MKQLREKNVLSVINIVDENELVIPFEEKFAVETLVGVLMNINSDGIMEYDETMFDLTRIGSFLYSIKRLDLDLKNWPTLPAKPFIEEPLVIELKELRGHIQYVFLGEINTSPMSIKIKLVEH